MMRGEGISRRWVSIIGGAVTVLLVPLREVLVRADEDMIIFLVFETAGSWRRGICCQVWRCETP